MMSIEKAAFAFQTDSLPISCQAFGSGHINNTFCVVTEKGTQYVLQRINRYVFKNPIRMMNNTCAITDYLRTRIEDPRMTLQFIPSKDGKFYHKTPDGEFWRMSYLVGGFTLDAPESDEDFYQSALAFGRFQELLSNFPADSLYEVIPNFHNTQDRYAQFKESVELDCVGRVAETAKDIAFLMEREQTGCILQKMLDAGILPLRVTHNDTKLNNVLLDSETRKSLCVLDLDTVMAGSSLYDYGDAIRYGAATAAEDEKDTSKMHLDLHLFEVFTRGYLEAAPALTNMEVATLPLGALVMTLELAVRFLKDYLDGDLYFSKIAYPEHNLVRARSQMALVADMEKKWTQMNLIVAKVANELRH